MKRESRPHLYKCPYCWRKFYNRESAVDHIKVSHGSRISNDSSRSTRRRRSGDDPDGTLDQAAQARSIWDESSGYMAGHHASV